MNLEQVVADTADALTALDRCGTPFKHFRAGVGPYGEPQLVQAIKLHLNALPPYSKSILIKRTPDLLITKHWALEFKITRPFGDNGKEAENWSVNLLHPYMGNVSAIGDCLKLEKFDGPERRGIVVVGYEHTPPRIPLAPLIDAFEILATRIAGVGLGPRLQVVRTGLCHPVHQQFGIFAWEVLSRRTA